MVRKERFENSTAIGVWGIRNRKKIDQLIQVTKTFVTLQNPTEPQYGFSCIIDDILTAGKYEFYSLLDIF